MTMKDYFFLSIGPRPTIRHFFSAPMHLLFGAVHTDLKAAEGN